MEQRSRDQELADALEQQRVTAEILRVISNSPTDVQPVFDMVARSAARICGARFCQVFRFDGKFIHFAAHHALPAAAVEDVRSTYPIPPGRGSATARAIASGAVEQIPDVLADSDYARRSFAEIMAFRSIVAVPMMLRGAPVGAIALGRIESGNFPAHQIRLLQTFADEAVIAIENVRLFQELQSRNRELTEALEQQTSTAEILRVISSSPTDLRPVLDAVVESAARLCRSDDAIIRIADGDSLRRVAHFGPLPDLASTEVHPILSSSVGSRAFLERRAIHVQDIVEEFEKGNYRDGRALQDPIGYRTILAAPLLRKDAAVGVILIRRMNVEPFGDKQIALLETFADQAVIAIENVRLFRELQSRNRELTATLEQQTATAEILRAISGSPSDATPVFEAIVRNAVALCGSLFANVFRYDGELLHYVASHNTGPGYVELLQSKYPMRPDMSQVAGRVILSKSIVRLEDARADPDYDQRFPKARGWRRMLGVPMLREGAPLGVIVVGWDEAGPVPRAQEELLITFADQAVIAIENVRLFGEIQEKSRQLELANTYKSRFLAAASHDLRQPLHALNLFVAQLHAEPNPAERRRLVMRIDAAVSAMNELFNALLDMSKLDAGMLEVQLTDFPVQRLFKQMETTFAEAAREKGLQLSASSSRDRVRSDFILLERILLNLVSNAVRYTERGEIVIACHRRGERLRIDVQDSGPGIPEDQQRDIFREFYQLAGSEHGPRGGLGLGLAIVDRLCRLLDHPIELASAPGAGSRFSVSVPLAAERPGLAEAPAVLPSTADPMSGRLIVVIDDDALVLDGMRGILRTWGCSVVSAASDAAALAELQETGRRPDAIISDYRLAGGMTGIDAIERLCSELGAAIPAFLISGDTSPKRLRDARVSGYHLLHKPVPPMTLRAMLSRLLKAAGRPGEAARKAKR